MANEQRGALSELALLRALERLGARYGHDLHWHSTPAGLLVCQSDVTVGSDPDNPAILFQVCSSGYAGGYQKKFWRDLGELLEVRRVFPRCRVVNVLFEPGAKSKLLAIADFVTDGVVQVSTLEDGPRLLERIAHLVSQGLPASSDAKYRLARELFPDAVVVGLATRLAGVLARPLTTWQLNHIPGVVQETEPTGNLRRAFLCAALFSTGADLVSAEPFLQTAVRGDLLPVAPFLPALADLGLCAEGLGNRFHLTDENLLRTLRRLTVPTFLDIGRDAIAANPGSRLFAYVSLIQHLPELIPCWFAAIQANRKRLRDPSVLTRALERNFAEPAYLLGTGGEQCREPWLFRRLLDLIRAADGKHFAIGIPRFDPAFIQAGLPALRFLISDYIAGRRPLTPQEATVAASVLAPELHRIAGKMNPSLAASFAVMVRRSEFQQRLLTYRDFDPLPTLLKRRGFEPVCQPLPPPPSPKRGGGAKSPSPLRGGVGEGFSFDSATITPAVVEHLRLGGSATCEASIRGDTISMWQSAGVQGVAHKVKELVGRMGLCCLTVTVDEQGKRLFRFREDLPNRALYTDGAWGPREVQAVRAGVFTAVERVM